MGCQGWSGWRGGAGVLIRANDKCALDFHIDTDDGNAFLLKQGQLVTVLGKEE